ncbi:peptide ABC transporter permease [Microbacterium sp. SZ1]|uniref:ABC transporter permease n=1 Tax=unclassified Microbacterium TaxID=2609290 RepID=UPI000BBCBEA8|nr:ABC transporter permease [Microbacterium sp. SZ1]PCE14075.1 peptide ABC transporter permease [Microbacterium sp. SZ1]
MSLEAIGVSPEITEQPQKPRSRKRTTMLSLYTRRFLRNRGAVIGVVILAALILFAIVGPLIAPYSHTDLDFLALRKGPSADHWFGTNGSGNDNFAQVAVGLQRSMMIAALVAVGTTVVSAIVGTTAAYFGGAYERIMLAIIHFMMVVPNFLILAMISNDAGGNWLVISLVMVFIVGWFFPARIIWTLSLSIREREYVHAARYAGLSGMRVVLRHMLPNIGSLLVINFTLGVVSAVLTETALSFLGFGVKLPDVSLGALIGYGSSTLVSAPWLFYFPAAALTLLTVSMALIADGLRDALDPTSAAGGRA